MKDFDKSLTNIGINKKGKDDLISVLTKARDSFNTVKTQFLRSGNINQDLTNKELSDFFSKRLKYPLSNDNKIINNKKLFKINKYAPTKDAKEKVVNLFINYAEQTKDLLLTDKKLFGGRSNIRKCKDGQSYKSTCV